MALTGGIGVDRAIDAVGVDAQHHHHVTPTGLADIANTILEHLAPQTAAKDRDDKTASQSLQLSDVPDGGYLTADLDPETTALLRAALTKFTPEAKITVGPDGLVTPAGATQVSFGAASCLHDDGVPPGDEMLPLTLLRCASPPG